MSINNTSGKICYICKSFKPFVCFYKLSKSKDGFKYHCKECQKINHKKRYENNKNYILNQNKEWRKKNKEKVRFYWKKDGPKRIDYFKEYRRKNKNKRKIYQRNLLKQNVNYRISSTLRHRIYMAVKSQNTKKVNKTMTILGCNIHEFKSYLQSQFKEGMNWENYGKWHIDHIKSCASFNLSNDDEQKQCFHYTNMQPLWASENFRKGKY